MRPSLSPQDTGVQVIFCQRSSYFRPPVLPFVPSIGLVPTGPHREPYTRRMTDMTDVNSCTALGLRT